MYNTQSLNDYTHLYKTVALSIIIYVLLMLTASIVLIFAFDFPDILRKPIEEMLGLFHENRVITVPAYYVFVLSGVAFIMMVSLLYKIVTPKDSVAGFMALVSGILFGLLSNLGFIRWPFLMDYLGQVISDPATSETQRQTIEIVFNSFHNYAGVAVGENFAFWFEGFWILFFSASISRQKNLFPSYLSKLGTIIGAGMLIYTLEQFGGVFSVMGHINMLIHAGFLIWLLAVAILLIKKQPELGKFTSGFLILGYIILLVTAYA